MLRSLVGSEMCIRDRLVDAFGTLYGAFESCAIDEAVLEEAEISGDWKDCLLYTSDAADDLLCVDLGGRRIIKKKKKRENTVRQLQCTERMTNSIHNSHNTT